MAKWPRYDFKIFKNKICFSQRNKKRLKSGPKPPKQLDVPERHSLRFVCLQQNLMFILDYLDHDL